MASIETIMDSVPFYERWQKEEGIPIIEDFFIQDLRKVPPDRTVR